MVQFDLYTCIFLCFALITITCSLTLRCARSRIRYSFFANIPFLWNSIPYDIVNSTSYVAFKYKLKSFFFPNQTPYVGSFVSWFFGFGSVFIVRNVPVSILSCTLAVLCVVITGGAPT